MKHYRITTKLLGPALLLPLLLAARPATAQTLPLRLPEASVRQGEEVVVPLYVDQTLTSRGVFAFALRIEFNGSLLALAGIDRSGTLTEGWGDVVSNGGPGYASVAGAAGTALEGSGVLVKLRFQALQAGYTPLVFNPTRTFLNEGRPAVAFDDGFVTVDPLPELAVYPHTALLTAGDQQAFTAGGGTAPYGWAVTQPSVAAIDAASGVLTAVAAGVTQVRVTDAAGVSRLSGPVEVRALKLTLPVFSGLVGSTVAVPVTTTDVGGLGIVAGRVVVSYNPSVFTLTGVETAGTLLDGENVEHHARGGAVAVAFAGTTPLSGAGVLFRLQGTLSGLPGQATPLVAAEALFNEDLAATTVDGWASISEPAALSVSPSSASLLAGTTLAFSVYGGTPPYTWSTSDASVATIDASGLLTAHQGGPVTVTVAGSGGEHGTTEVLEVYDVSLTLPTLQASEGDTVDVPLALSDPPAGQALFALRLALVVDPSVLEVVGFRTAGTLIDGWAYSHRTEPGVLRVAAAGTAGLGGAGTLVVVRLRPRPGSTGTTVPLAFGDVLLNEGTPRVLPLGGALTVVAATVPEAPRLLAPAAGATGVAVTPTFSWAAAARAAAYDFTLATDADFTAPVDGQSGLTALTYTPAQPLAAGTTYYWRVRGTNPDGPGPWSTASFTTAVARTITVTGPAAGAVWPLGSTQAVTWTSTGLLASRDVRILLVRAGMSNVLLATTPNDGAHTVTVPGTLTPASNYRVRIVSTEDNTVSALGDLFAVTAAGGAGRPAEEPLPAGRPVPEAYALGQNYPNPFNPETSIPFDVPEEAYVRIEVYNTLGQCVRRLVDRVVPAGSHRATFASGDLPSGLYLCRMEAAGVAVHRVMLLIR